MVRLVNDCGFAEFGKLLSGFVHGVQKADRTVGLGTLDFRPYPL
jgi:hypothetical protein